MESTESTLPPISSPSTASPFSPAPRRSLIRRLTPWAASTLLLAGGSYGAYQYAVSLANNSAEASDNAAHSSTASESLKQLLASSTDAQNSTSPGDSSASTNTLNDDRYAYSPDSAASSPPDLPSAAPPESSNELPATPPADVQNPFASAAPNAGDRYVAPPIEAHLTTQSAPSGQTDPGSIEQLSNLPPESAAKTPTSEEAITRGQGPDYNPLRAGVDEQGVGDARYAFEDANPPAQTSGDPAPPNPAAEQGSSPYDNTAPYGNAMLSARGSSSTMQNPYASPADGAAPYEPARAVDVGRDVMTQAEPLPPRGALQENLPSQQVAPNSTQAQQLRQSNPYAAGGLSDDASGSFNGVTPTPGIVAAEGTGRPGERILEGAQSPAISIQKLAPAEIQVGMKCTFAIRVQNHGQRAAQGVRIVDEVPVGTTLMGTAPKANVAATRVEWDLGTLSVGEERIVEMELLPNAEGEIGSVATVMFAAQASAKARCTKPELALRLTSQPTVMIGGRQKIQIEVANPGTGDATGVVLLENIPEGVSHEAGPALEYPIGTLRAGETKQLELILSAEQPGKINNIMTARADARLFVEANCEFEVLAPDLRVSVNGPKRRYLERPAKYTVTINNPGTASARDVQLVTQLPQGLQFVSADNYGEYDQASHSIFWSLEELPAGKDGAVELVALPVESGEHKLQFGAKAQQGLEDRTEQSVMVEGLAALMFEVVDVDDPIEVGGETTYEIRVVNQGSKSAANVQVLAALPRGMQALSAQGETRHEIQANTVRFLPLPRLAPKAESTFRVTARGTVAGDQRVRVQVIADEFSQPITKEASTRVYADDE